MKHLQNQINKAIKTKQRAQSDLIDCQKNLVNAIQARLNREDGEALSQSDCERYNREMNELFRKIDDCNLVIREFITLQQINE